MTNETPSVRRRERPSKPALVAVRSGADDETRETLAEIERLIDNPPRTSVVMTITPEVAEKIISKYNLVNRPKKSEKIGEYSADMSTGFWFLTGDTLKFSDARMLADGQNRLFACMNSGVSFETHVVFGIPAAAFVVIDRTKTRSASDVLAIATYSNTTVLYAAIRWVYLINEGTPKSRVTMLPQKALELMRSGGVYETLPDMAKAANRIYAATKQPKGIVAALLAIFHLKNPKKAAAFTTAWETETYSRPFGALHVLKSKLSAIGSVSSGRVHDVVRAALIIKAWNAYLAGHTSNMKALSWEPHDEFPEIGG